MRLSFLLPALVCLAITGCAVMPGIPASPAAMIAQPAPVDPEENHSWTPLLEIQIEQPMRVAAFADARFGLTGGPSAAGKSFVTINGGQTWRQAESSAECLFALDIVSPEIIWQCSLKLVLVSKDGGQTWQPVAGYDHYCRQLRFLDSTTGWVSSTDHLTVTTDGGSSWEAVPLPEQSADIAAVGLRTAADGYLLDINAVVHITADGGQTWHARPLPISVQSKALPLPDSAAAAVHFFDADHGIVVAHVIGETHSYIMAFETEDGGRSWKEETVMQAPIMVSLYLSHDGQTLTVGDLFGSRITLLQRTISP